MAGPTVPRDFAAWMSDVGRRLQGLERRTVPGGPRQMVDTGPPTAGTWERTTVVWNANPVPGGVIGWVCTTGGTPGVWRPWGTIGP